MSTFHDWQEDNCDSEAGPSSGHSQWRKPLSPFNADGSISKNQHGNVDVRKGVPNGLTHLPAKAYDYRNIHGICRHLKIPCATALVGFDHGDGPSVPIKDGVVIPSSAYQRLMADLERRRKVDRERQERKRVRQTPKLQPPLQAEGSDQKGGD